MCSIAFSYLFNTTTRMYNPIAMVRKTTQGANIFKNNSNLIEI